MANDSLHPTPNAAAAVARYVADHRDLFEFGPDAISVVLKLASSLNDERENADASAYATSRNVGALIDCARLSVERLSEITDALLESAEAKP